MSQYRIANPITCFSRIFAIISMFLALFLWTEGAEANDELIYSMTPGDNLWNITERYLNDGFSHWNSLIRHNNVTDPLNMPPGTQIRIPLRWLKIDPATVKVSDVHGKVQYLTAENKELKPLSNKTLLKDGDKVVVATDANVVLEFTDKSKLLLGSGSEMELVQINKFSDSGLADTKVKLQKGRTETRVKTKNTRFQITTPSANTTVRGTDFRVTIDKDNPDLSRVEVISGLVRTMNNIGNRDVNAGFGTIVTKSTPPGSLNKLLPKPDIQSPPNYSRQLPVDFKWKAIDGSVQYRIQIHNASGEQTLLFDEVIQNHRFNTSNLEDGKYIIRVRAIDSNGLEGINAEYSLQLDARPQPPLPISPEYDETVRKDLPEFEWSIPSGITGYHFQLSTHSDLSSPLIDSTEFTGTKFTPEQLAPGKYYWRMSTYADTKQGPFGQVQSFTLKPPPKAPDLSKITTEEDESNFTLHWPSGNDGQQYKIQMATDPDFNNLIVEKQLKTAEFIIDRPSQEFYIRIKIIDIDGFEGDWSVSQKIEAPLGPWYYFLIPTIPFLTCFLLVL